MGHFLEYVPGTSLLHRMNPVAKLVGALLLSVACFVTGSAWFIGLVLVFDLVMAWSCGMLGRALGLARAVFFFSLILAVIQLLTTPEGAVLVELPWGYVGTGSLLVALTTVLRLIAAAVPLFLMLYVTQLADLSNALVKRLHVPYRYAFAFTSTVRFIPVFMNDMKGIMEAQTARGVEFDTDSLVKKVRLMVPLCVPLLVSSVRKANSSAIAAEVRGFYLRSGESAYKEYPFAVSDVVAMLLCAVLLAVAVVLAVL